MYIAFVTPFIEYKRLRLQSWTKVLGTVRTQLQFYAFHKFCRKKGAVFLQIHVPAPLPTQYNVERSKELCLDGFNTVCGVGEGVGTYSASSARVQFCVC